jgi:hypothetical protein
MSLKCKYTTVIDSLTLNISPSPSTKRSRKKTACYIETLSLMADRLPIVIILDQSSQFFQPASSRKPQMPIMAGAPFELP